MRSLPVKMALRAFAVWLVVLAANLPAAAAPVPTPAALRLDPAVEVPQGPLRPEVVRRVNTLLAGQAAALTATDLAAYLAAFATPPVSPAAPVPSASVGSGVVGRPMARAEKALFVAMGAGAVVEQAGVSPVFVVPGADGTIDVLARHVVAYRTTQGERRLLVVVALERLRPVATSAAETQGWEVFDWFVCDEEAARSSWPVWLTGRITLEPFDRRLTAEMTYTIFPGSPDAGPTLDFELATTFEVASVHGQAGGLSWKREGETIMVTLPDRPSPDQPVKLTINYAGFVTPGGTPHRGRLEYLGAEGIYLRPDTGWYPRLDGGGFVRGALAVTVPAWWAAVAPGRMTAASPAGGTGEVRTFGWGLDTPAELYLAAGPYLVSERVTAGGTVLRSFFYAREAEWAEACLGEAERILAFFSDRLGGYPYPNLTLAEVQDFYYGGVSARSFILLDKEWLANPDWDTGTRSLLVHELSHQWWGEVVPINEAPDWFLWEGLASYSEALYAEATSGPDALSAEMRAKETNYSRASRSHRSWSLAQANVRDFDWQDTIVYDKGAWVFHTLRFFLGDDGFARFLRAYIEEFNGRQPTTEDFGALVAEVGQGDPYLAGFAKRWVEEPGEPELALSRVSVERREGLYILRFTVLDRNMGDFPRAEVRVFLRGGQEKTLVVPSGENTIELPGRPKSLFADPDYEVLDLKRTNNLYYFWFGIAVPGAAVLPTAGAVLVAAAVGLVVVRRRPTAQRPVD